MPQLVVSDEGERFLLKRNLKPSSADPLDLILHLYSNNYTPLKDWTLANVVELALSGYSPVTLLESDWSDPVTLFGAAASQWGVGGATFGVTSGTAYVYGYYVTDFGVTQGVWAQRFDTPFLISATLPLTFTPSLRGESMSEP